MAQVAPLFIYFRHTPKGIKFLVSRDVTPQGVAKKLILRNDEDAQLAEYVINAMKAYIRITRCFTATSRPNFSEVISAMNGELPADFRVGGHVLHSIMIESMSNRRYERIMYIAADGRMGERIMFVPKKEEN